METSEEIRYNALKNDIGSLSNRIGEINNSLNAITNKLNSNSKDKDGSIRGKFEGWEQVVTVFVGILSGIAILLTQFSALADVPCKLSRCRVLSLQLKQSLSQ